MATAGLYFLMVVAVALFAGTAIKPQAIGWFVIGLGLFFLMHAGVTIAIIWAHDNVVPTYVNFYFLFATIPVGVTVVLLGIGNVCIHSCVRRQRERHRRAE